MYTKSLLRRRPLESNHIKWSSSGLSLTSLNKCHFIMDVPRIQYPTQSAGVLKLFTMEISNMLAFLRKKTSPNNKKNSKFFILNATVFIFIRNALGQVCSTQTNTSSTIRQAIYAHSTFNIQWATQYGPIFTIEYLSFTFIIFKCFWCHDFMNH